LVYWCVLSDLDWSIGVFYGLLLLEIKSFVPEKVEAEWSSLYSVYYWAYM